MNKISVSLLFLGALNLCASDQPARADQELVTAAVAACSLKEDTTDSGWKRIVSSEDVKEFAGKIVEFQVEPKKFDPQARLCPVPGFLGSFFGYIFGPHFYPQYGYRIVLFYRPNEDNFYCNLVTFGETFFLDHVDAVMRPMSESAKKALQNELQRGNGVFQCQNARHYREQICAILGVKKLH